MDVDLFGGGPFNATGKGKTPIDAGKGAKAVAQA
jgi:hypothetical protein